MGNYKFAHLTIMEALLARAHVNDEDLGDWEMSALTKELVNEILQYKKQQEKSPLVTIIPKDFIVQDMREEFDRLGYKYKANKEKESNKYENIPLDYDEYKFKITPKE